jgi:hypothetical protein
MYNHFFHKLYKVYQLEDIFKSINDIKNKTICTIAKVISTDLLICKQVNNDELKLLQIQIADSTGVMKAILKNELIHRVKIGKEFIFRNAKAEIINDLLVLVCDENSILFDSNDLIKIENINVLENDFSKIKIFSSSTDMIN